MTEKVNITVPTVSTDAPMTFDAAARPAPTLGPSGKLKKIQPPTATPGAVAIAVLFALILLVIAAIAIHDFIIEVNWISGSQWLAAVSRWIGDLSWQAWMWPVAVALVFVGVLLLIHTFKPRPKTHFALTYDDPIPGYQPALWTRRVDVSRRASAAAREVAGVYSARTKTSRRTAVVRVRTALEKSAAQSQVREAVLAALNPFGDNRKVVVRAKVLPAPQSSTPLAAQTDMASGSNDATESATSTSAEEAKQ